MNSTNNVQHNINHANLPGFKQALLLIGVYVLASVSISPLLIAASNFSPMFKQWSMLIGYLVPFIIVVFIGMRWWNVPVFDSQKVSITVYMLTIPLIIAMAIIMEGIVGLIPMPKYFRDLFEQMIQLDLAGYITLGIAAPILEELVFRGIVLKKFLEKYTPYRAIIYSALIFGIGHLNPWQFVAAFTIGIAIGWIYWKTKSIWPGIFIHFVNNSFSFYLAKKYNDIDITFYDIIGNPYAYASLIILCLLVCYSVYLILNKYFLNTSNE